MPDPSSLPIAEIKAELFKSLAHPERIRVLEVLADGERSVGELQQVLGLEQSHLSQLLRVLRRANVVTSRKAGANVYYSLRDPLVGDLLNVARELLVRSLTETRALLSGLTGPGARR